MSRIKHQFQDEHLFELKSLVEFTFGKQILSLNDCVSLSESIFEKVKISISTDTLRRLFGLIDTKSQPSLFTLETLSKYVGFGGYYDFINSLILVGKHFFFRQILDCTSNKIMPFEALKALEQSKPSVDYYSTIHQLIHLAFHKKDTLFFERFFINQSGFEWLPIFKYEIYQTIQILGKLVEKNSWLQEIALKSYIGLPFYFDYFIEWYVPEDQIYYQNLLEKYKEKHSENPEKLIFYNCIAAIKSFRNNEFTQLEACNKTIEFLESQCEPNNILKARALGVHFINDLKKGDLKAENKILEIDFESWFPDIGDRVTSMFFLFNYLFEAKSFNLMIKLFERWLSQDSIFFSIWTRVNWNQLCVYMTYAYLNENKKELAEKYFSEVNISLFEVYNFDRFQELYSKVKTKFNLL
jgi:hypothetical protein